MASIHPCDCDPGMHALCLTRAFLCPSGFKQVTDPAKVAYFCVLVPVHMPAHWTYEIADYKPLIEGPKSRNCGVQVEGIDDSQLHTCFGSAQEGSGNYSGYLLFYQKVGANGVPIGANASRSA
jgi:hypothetical protein